MNRVKRILILILAASVLISALAGCGTNKENTIETLVRSTVPIAGMVDGRWTKAKILEKDSFGRILFSVSFPVGSVAYTKSSVFGYGICQGISGDICKFYEDIFYVIAESEENITCDDVEKLKQVNDWMQPLNDEKMVQISTQNIESKYDKYASVEKAIRKHIGISDISIHCYWVGNDTRGNSLWLASADKKIEQPRRAINAPTQFESLGVFFAIFKADRTVTVEQIQELYNYQEQLLEFKQKNSWQMTKVVES